MQFSNTVTIRRPPHEVFDYLADPANIPSWNYAVSSTHVVTPGPIGVGSRLRQTRSVPRASVEELEVIEFVPHRLLELRGDVGPLTGTLRYETEAVPEGTRLTNAAHLEGRGALGVLAPLATNRVRDAVTANLEKLRELLEEPV
jgi:uncharacterized protein YndB with AHSA1/START domain